MKLWSVTLLTLIISLSLKGQIQKEHTFNSSTVRYFQVDKSKGYFSILNGQTLRFYHSDYSLYKEVNLPQKADSKPTNIFQLSQNLFDNNKSNLEFIVNYQDTVDYNITFAIVRENDNNVKQIKGSYGGIIEVNGKPKLLVRLDNQTEIYSLPGELNTNAPYPGNGNNLEEVALYPNPAKDQIKLQYQLSGNEIAEVKIYNATGHLKERLKAGPDFNHINLNVSGYKPGNYFYQVVVDKKVEYKGKFVVVN